jgi:hypothetical protein
MGRLTWFIAGAAAGAGALVATPDAYRRLRAVMEAAPSPAALTSGGERFEGATGSEPRGPILDPQAPGLLVTETEDTTELRIRIDETRARIHEKTQGADGQQPPGGK